MAIPNTTITLGLKEDFETSVKHILESTTEEVSMTLLTTLQSKFDPTLQKPAESEILANLLKPETTEILESEYLKLFSPKTQNFILEHFVDGVQGELEITIDNERKKGFMITIKGKDLLNNEDFEKDIPYKDTLLDIKKICKELAEYHYLGLWLEDGKLQSIKLDIPKTTTTKKEVTDPILGKKSIKTRVNSTQEREVNIYPQIILNKTE